MSPSHNIQHVWLASQIIDTHANTTENRANQAVLFASLINRNIEGPSCNLLSLDGNVGSVKKLLDFLGNHKFHSGMFGDYETMYEKSYLRRQRKEKKSNNKVKERD